MKQENQGEDMEMYHYASEEVYSYNLYKNTINNSFYCLPQPGDKVFGYIDNRGIAVILGCKRYPPYIRQLS